MVKLLIINNNTIEKIGRDYYSVYSWIRFPQYLAFHCERVTMWVPGVIHKTGTRPPQDYWRVEGNLHIEFYDYLESFSEYYRLWPRRALIWRRQAEKLIEEHDVIVLRVPSPMISVITKSARRKNKPLVVIISGNVQTQSDRIIANYGIKRFFYLILAKLLIYKEISCVRQATIVYAYSSELTKRHQKNNSRIKLMQTPHISKNDFIYRTDTCQSHEIRLVRICWLLPSKGLEYLLESMVLLIERGLPVWLEIVGKGRSYRYRQKLVSYAEQLGIAERIQFMGWIPFNKIQKIYTRSDIQIISSLAEGTPRNIIEGAARGLPLVSTRVGGCADVLIHEQNAILVSPGRPRAMADAIERIIKDGPLRRKLIKHGYEMALNGTFEQLGMKFLEDISDICKFDKSM